MKISMTRLKKRIQREGFLKEIGVIAIGTFIGILTYVLCLYLRLAIFGWNIGLVLAPLFAGYVESFFANKFLEESTGAISAIILFAVTVIYGFIISNPTLGFNIITVGSIVVIIQAAIPTATNYFLIVLLFAILSHIMGLAKKIKLYAFKFYQFLSKTAIFIFIREKFNEFYQILSKTAIYTFISEKFNEFYQFLSKTAIYTFISEKFNNVHVLKKSSINMYNDENFDLNALGVSLLSLESVPKENIIKNNGIYEARTVFTFSRRGKLQDPNKSIEFFSSSIKRAKDKALLKIIKDLKKDGCNALVNISIKYEGLGYDKDDKVMQVVIIGTGLILDDNFIK